ncbi:MAG: hypothetical protein IKQ55_01310 [Kiritimatiellae bacterium]|nr:hypothetical protein [Kiritimatiellia bacterium]
MYRLCFQSGRNKGKRLLVRQSSATVGSARSCTVRLREKECPWLQAFRLEKRPEGVVPVAIEAGEALRVNGVAPVAELPLQHGDVVAAGNVELQYQDIIPPDAPRLRPGGGVAQAMATLAILLIVGTELALLAFTANWPKHIIDENVERLDIEYARRQRRLEEQTREADAAEQGEGKEKKPDASSIIVMPGSSLVEAHQAAKKAEAAAAPETAEGAEAAGETGPAAAVPTAETAAGTETPLPPAKDVLADLPDTLREMLAGADFAPAQLGDVMSDVPEVALTDAIADNLESMLSQAKVAAQFSDYPRAVMLLNQIHKMAPGYLPAHMYHAQLLETRGDLEAAYGRWRQLLGLVGKDDPARDEIIKAGRRLQRQLRQQKDVGGHAGVDPESLPRRVRIADSSIQKMPSDSEIAEMRILRGKVELAEGGAEELELYVTFYDQKPDGKPVPTKALVSQSPLRLGTAGAAPSGGIPFEATYIVPAARRGGGRQAAPHESLYHGYTLHLFADGELQDAYARPSRLLELPIHVAVPAGAN